MRALRSVLATAGSVLLGLLVLGAVELALRLVLPGESSPASEVLLARIDPFQRQRGFLVTKERFRGVMRASRLAAAKPENTYRVFCLGGSSTMGYPYDAGIAWPAVLERRLRSLHPGREIEVINLGATSYGSGRVLGILRAIVDYDPDLVIVVSGNNEFVEDSFRTAAARPARGIRRLEKLALYRALRLVLPARRPAPQLLDAGGEGAAAFFFAPVLDGTVYVPSPRRRQEVLARYRANLREIAETARRRGLTLMLGTVPSNVGDWPPERQGDRPPPPEVSVRWRQAEDRAGALERAGRRAEAGEAYAAAALLWDGDADFHFRYGTFLREESRFEPARHHLIRARDEDPSPIRATTDINGAVREVARSENLPLLDLERIFEAASPGGIVGHDLILDNVHPTPRGHVEIARAAWAVLSERDASWGAGDPRAEAELRQREAQVGDAPPAMDGNLALVWGQIYLRKGMSDRAIAHFRSAIAQGNDLPYASFGLAAAHFQKGELAEALPLLEEVVRTSPDFTEPYPLLALVCVRLGRVEEGLRHYRRALRAGNAGRELTFELGNALAEAGSGEALPVLAEALARHPGDCALASARGRAVEVLGDRREAERLYREIVEADPSCLAAWENLGLLLMSAARWEEAREVFSGAIRQAPSYPVHHLNLGYVHLEGLGDTASALAQFDEFLALDPGGIALVPPALRGRLGTGPGPAAPGP